MSLTIKAVQYKGLPPVDDLSARFDAQGGSIGRSPTNDLVLPDPEKFISRLHAQIRFENGHYVIEDASAAGTVLNDGDAPLQHSTAILKNGDRLRIGEYDLMVFVEDEAVSPVSAVLPPIVEPVRQLDLMEGSVLDGPFGAAEVKPSPEFFASFVEQPDSSPIHESFSLPGVTPTPTTTDELDLGDLLSTLDDLPAPATVFSSSAHAALDLPELPADFFTDDVPPAAESISIPETEPSSDDISARELEPSFATPESVRAAPVAPDWDAKSEPAVAPLPTPGAASAVSIESAPPVVMPSVAVPVSQKTEPTHDIDPSLLQAFLAGAGIHDPNLLPPEQWPDVMQTSGELLRAMVAGLMQVLRARAELKSQFRVSVTTMRSLDNNPLKFTPNVDDALKLLLAPTNPGFLVPKQAVSEGFNDIMNHQVAMTAGIQAALADILESFDPQRIEKSCTDGVLFQKKAKCWERYVESYPSLKAAAQDEFFGEAFADAYEKQMVMLGRSPKSS